VVNNFLLSGNGNADGKIYKSLNNGLTWDAGTLVVAGTIISDIIKLANGST